MAIVPHDILKIENPEKLPNFSGFPEWAKQACLASPYHVVRRAPTIKNQIPIGIRGKQRNERFGCYVLHDQIERVIHPTEIVQQKLWKTWRRKNHFLTMIETLDQLDHLFTGLAWGVGGSLGYELISTLNTIHEHSDIDLIWYQSHAPDFSFCKNLIHEITQLPIKVDIQVENAKGGFHLAEYVRHPHHKILLKQNDGPVLSDNIWYL